MKVAYYLNEGRGKNLYCRISDGEERVTFSLGYSIDPKSWNNKKEELPDEDQYYFTLQDFKSYLQKRYHELQSSGQNKVLTSLKKEALSYIDKIGIEGIARKMFDDENQKLGIPCYDDFLKAFEKYSTLKRGQYKAQTVGHIIHFYSDKGNYEVDTYQGLTSFLKSIIERRSYDEIVTMTKENIWSSIYIDAGIEKHDFVPVMHNEWEIYWDNLYDKIKQSVGKTAHLDQNKERSWREFQIFMECYEGSGDSIELASKIDDMTLLPLAVITMLNIFDQETCYLEYCEFELEGEEWESISLGYEEKDDNLIFYIKELDQ